MNIILKFLSTENIRSIIGDVKNPLRDAVRYATFPLNIDTVHDFLLANEFENTELFLGEGLQMHENKDETLFNYPYTGKTVHGKSKTLRLKNFVSRIKHSEIIFYKLKEDDNKFVQQIPSLKISCCSSLEFFTKNHTNITFTSSVVKKVVVENDMDTLDISKSGVENIEMRANVKRLILPQTLVTETMNFRNVHTLNLSNTWVEDVSALGNVHTLDLNGCIRLSNVSALGGVHSLNLSGCHGISDVSMLGGVYELNLSSTSPQGVNNLGNVHILNLSGCENITNNDVTFLGKVYDLDLSMTTISNISSLKDVPILKLQCCTEIVDFSMLGSQKLLDLFETNINDASNLGRVRVLCLGCTKVTDVSMLGGVDCLDISECNVTDFSALGNVRCLNLGSTKVSDLSFVKTVHTLDLFGCKLITDFSPLQEVRILNLEKCKTPSIFPVLENLVEIDIACTLIKYTQLIKMKNLKIVYDATMLYEGNREENLKKNGIKIIKGTLNFHEALWHKMNGVITNGITYHE
jgi:hypothetical protein